MTRYVRFVAYMDAIPHGGDKPRRSGMEDIVYPPVDEDEPLLYIMHTVGFAEIGPNPLTWREIEAYARLSGLSLSPWETETIRQLSCAYVTEYRKAGERGAFAPWSDRPSRDEVDAAIGAAFGRKRR